MSKINLAASFSATLFVALLVTGTSAFSQGFGGYVAPQTEGTPNANASPVAQPAPQRAITNVAPGQATSNAQTTAAPVPSASANNVQGQARSTVNAQGGYIADEQAKNAFLPPPDDYNPSQEELEKLDEFLVRWEEHGKNIKRVSCNVHMREFDSVHQSDPNRPVQHTWGEFRFITPNKLSYHIQGEFEYSDANPNGVWKKGQNEWKVTLDGKTFTQYDFKAKKAIVYPIVEDEQDIDLTMDNGQFPLFFIAKAKTLKSRFYLKIVTPDSKQKSEVWINAYPRFARDAQQFQLITVVLDLKDLQPSYMRKLNANGKSKTDLKFEKVTVNKGTWTIDGSVPQTWAKETHEEQFSVLNQQIVVMENGTIATLVSDPSQFPSNKRPNNQETRTNATAQSTSRVNRQATSAQAKTATRR